MRTTEQHFNKIKSTSTEIAHLANIVQNNIKITPSQFNEWKIRKSLLIEKLKIMLDETEKHVEEFMLDE